MRYKSGFTLLEILVALGILGVLSVIFLQIFTNTLSTTTNLNSRNNLINEGQLAVRVISSRLQEACYVYPQGSTITLASSGWTTQKTVGGSGYNWVVGTDPIVAMLLPPEPGSNQYRFFAYFAMTRAFYQSNASASERLEPDTQNTNALVLMEYRANIDSSLSLSTGQTCQVLAANLAGGTDTTDPSVTPTNLPLQPLTGSRRGIVLVDYVQPGTPLFTVPATTGGASAPSVGINLSFLKQVQGRTLVVNGASANGLNITVFPRNINAGAATN
ncbi:MAG: prepilin-type N-terminal cleavage/methylation domain-containing protein [Thermaceae bacterium]|nr:prepilin-type N-terminal cleavage/methylation domain-containing protein [Thermaceae bacterium]